MYIYLDESGDLGFDFTKQGTSRFFVITLLIVYSNDVNKKILKMIERTLKRKVNKRKKGKNSEAELKGSKTDITVKRYFYRLVKDDSFEICTLILNKARVIDKLRKNKPKLYNYISKLLLEKCQFGKVQNRVSLTVDKCKNKEETKDFNNYLLTALRKFIPVTTPFVQYHEASYAHKGLQAVDLFSWGVYRKYERSDLEWYSEFHEKIKVEIMYLPARKRWF